LNENGVAVATESPTPPSTPVDEYPRAISLRHFENGLRLYEDRNYVGALAEFEAAYRSYPSGSALQNVALCQKQLFRYSEAKDTLERLLTVHSVELADTDRKAVRDAEMELGSLVGTIRIIPTPASAKITLDDRTLADKDLKQTLALDVGEHRIVAEADGFAPLTRVFRVAGGQTDIPVELHLVETSGLVEIVAPDAQTAIAIDGRPVAFSSFVGRLVPGKHFIQVYREGFEPYEEELDVTIGAKYRVVGKLGEATDTVIVDASPSNQITTKRNLRGFYGLGAFSVLAVRGHPVGFVADSNYDLGYELGFRVGYRLLTPLGFEMAVASGSYVVQGHCADTIETTCPVRTNATYHLDTRRIGANIRLMSQGETLRLFSVAGTGLVSQDFKAFGHQASGYGLYAQLEFGVAMNYRHSLWELGAQALFDEAARIGVGSFRPYKNGSGLQFFGISARVGWSDWFPPHKVPPLPQKNVAPSQLPSPEHNNVELPVAGPSTTSRSRTPARSP
jgi:hypothetical protein